MILSEFLSLFKQGKVTAHSHMKNLIELAMADGHYDASEDAFLNRLASKYGVTKKKLEEIRQNPSSIEFLIPDNPKEKFVQLYELINMMVIDDHIDSEEVRLCEIFARKFGYSPTKTVELVESIASNIRHGNTQSETHQRVAWLLD